MSARGVAGTRTRLPPESDESFRAEIIYTVYLQSAGTQARRLRQHLLPQLTAKILPDCGNHWCEPAPERDQSQPRLWAGRETLPERRENPRYNGQESPQGARDSPLTLLPDRWSCRRPIERRRPDPSRAARPQARQKAPVPRPPPPPPNGAPPTHTGAPQSLAARGSARRRADAGRYPLRRANSRCHATTPRRREGPGPPLAGPPLAPSLAPQPPEPRSTASILSDRLVGW
jgi:hypothetical protein